MARVEKPGFQGRAKARPAALSWKDGGLLSLVFFNSLGY